MVPEVDIVNIGKLLMPGLEMRLCESILGPTNETVLSRILCQQTVRASLCVLWRAIEMIAVCTVAVSTRGPSARTAPRLGP